MFRGWGAFQEMERLRREIDRVFDGYGGDSTGWLRSAFLPGRSARAYPLVNIYEDDDQIRVEALAPGLVTESLRVSVEGNTLTIAGEKGSLGEVETEQFHRNERATGKFLRSIQLGTDIDSGKVNARYENGLLYVNLGKAEDAKPKQIQVKVQ